MEFPEDLRYTKDHEWARTEGGTMTVGITGFAVEQLGDITLVDLPEVGDEVTAGEAFGVIESVKSVSDLYAPVSGSVAAINEALEDRPELVNESPYGDGWLVKIAVAEEAGEGLMNAQAYAAMVAEES
jgi:glycine cleavage system H protein